MSDRELSLPVAAFKLGVSYEIAKRQLFRGELEGRQDDDGRWKVKAASVERAIAARDLSPSAA